MQGIEGEKLILESDNQQLRLTSHRLRYHETRSSKSDFTSIMLDKISSIQVTYQSASIWLLIFGLFTIPILLGFYIIYLYFSRRSHYVFIYPDGGQPIVFQLKGIKRDYIDDFIDKVEEASIKLKQSL